MKRIIAMVLILGCAVMSLTGCGLVFGAINSIIAAANPDYEAEEMTFYKDEFSITLTDAFYESADESYMAYYSSANGTTVQVHKYSFDTTEFEPGCSPQEYAEKLIEIYSGISDEFAIMSATNFSPITVEDDMAYFTCNMTLVVELKYMTSVHITDGAIIVVDMTTLAMNYEDVYAEPFTRWTRSVKISRANATA